MAARDGGLGRWAADCEGRSCPLTDPRPFDILHGAAVIGVQAPLIVFAMQTIGEPTGTGVPE